MFCVVVLMSTFQGEQYLRQQIDSILAQKGVAVKLIVRDDGSTDSTLQILQEYQEKSKLIYTKGQNIGYRYSFMELCVNAPAADYYAFADQDDFWLPTKLLDAIQEIKKYKDIPALCSTNFQMVDNDLRPILKASSAYMYSIERYLLADGYQQIKTGCALNDIGGFGCTQVWNDKLQQIVSNKPYPQIQMDHDTILGMLAILCGKYTPCKQANILYRQHGNNVSGPKTGFRSLQYRVVYHIKRFLGKKGPLISQCNAALYEYYKKYMTEDAQTVIKNTIEYKDNCKNRLVFTISNYPKLLPYKLRIKFRLKVLLGKY